MKTLVLYYTLTGSTEAEALRIADEPGTTLCRISEHKPYRALTSFLLGCWHAMKRRASAIHPIEFALEEFDRIIIGCPIWAGFPAPAFNAAVELLPPGKRVEVFVCSGSGNTEKSMLGTKQLIEARGCTLDAYRDVKTAAPKE